METRNLPELIETNGRTMAPSAAAPKTRVKDAEIQAFKWYIPMPLALAREDCRQSGDDLNQLLADVIILRDLYKKHHWQASGPTFYPLHLLFDRHAGQIDEMIDQIAERIMTLGGVAIAMGADVAETTLIPRPPKGREDAATQLSRLLHAHEVILVEARTMARLAAERGDDGTNDLIVSSVIRTNETQVWFLAEHLVDSRAAGAGKPHADDGNGQTSVKSI